MVVSYGAAMRRSTLVMEIAIVCLAAILSGCIEQDGEMVKPAETELVLSDYPELFGKDVMIVIGSNASGIEIGGADAIVENLFNLTGNMAVIKTDAEITEDELAGHNLILVGGADSNEVLKEVYDMTDAMRVTDEYPGAGKGVLEILRNPWDPKKAMLLVAGSDELGVKAGCGSLLMPGNQSKIIAKGAITDKFNFLTNSYSSTDPVKSAEMALVENYGENWTNEYLILGLTLEHPLISTNHTFVRVDPAEFSILVTSERIYFLPLEDFNRFLDAYGNSISKLWSDRDIAEVFEIYLKLYGEPISVGGEPVGGGTYERLFTNKHLDELKEWVKGVKEKYDIDPKKFADLTVTEKDSYYLLDCYTIKHPVVPTPKSATISHYSVKVGGEGEIYPSLINESYYYINVNKKEDIS